MNRLSILFLILFVLSGCAFIPQKVLTSKDSEEIPVVVEDIPVEIKEIAKNILDYGDFYMKEQSKILAHKLTPDEKTLLRYSYKEYGKKYIPVKMIGSPLIKEEFDKITFIVERNYPKMDKNEVESTKVCVASLESYVYRYNSEFSDAVNSKIILDMEPILNTFQDEWNTVNALRESMIKDCKL